MAQSSPKSGNSAGKSGNRNDLQQMIINYVPGEECRVAMVENGRLEEFHDERANAVTIVGNVYVGKVMNVEASIQAAFVDFGHGANGFLHVSDLHPQYFPGEDEETKERIGKKTPRRERPPIQHCLKRNQEIIVQVLKEGISTKGPTLTTYLSIPGRYLVMLPQMDRVGVSRKVEDEDQRKEMRKILDGLELPGDFGFIVRTAGIGKAKTDLKRDLAYLQRLWKDIERRRSKGKGPRLLYAESDLLMRALRDYWTSEIHEIVIDDDSALRRAGRFMKIVSPRSATKLLNYNRSTPIFHAFGIEEQIQRMHERVVPLPSGGSLIIDEAEALVAIDVNSGKMRHHGDAETTAYKTNIEAVDEICRQIRLRDVGGLIVCDLIDMMKRSNRRNMEQRFRDRLKRDRAATKPLPVSQFGIVEMTRQRMRGSLRSTHYTKCPMCSGRGVLRRPPSLASDALRELGSIIDHAKVAKAEMVVSPRLAGELLSNKRLGLTRLELRSGKKVDVRVSEDIPVDQLRFYAYDEAGADVAIDRLPKPTAPTDLSEWVEAGTSGKDWAVDTLAEQDEIEAVLPTQHEQFDDFLSTDSEPDAESGEREGERTEGGKRRRRRRGGRGRRGGRDRTDEEKQGEKPTDERTTPDDERETETEDDHAADTRPHDQESDKPEDGKRRRRRRRRGGRGRQRTGEPAVETRASEQDRAEEPEPRYDEPEMRADEEDEEESPAPARATGLRGDSWDVTPEELASSNGKAPTAAEAPVHREPDEAPAPSEEESKPPARKKRRRSRGKKPAGGGAAESNQRRDESDQEPEVSAAAPEPDAPAEPGPAPARSKKRRSSRKKQGEAPQEREAKVDVEAGEPTAPASKKKRSKRRGSKKPEAGSGGKPDATPAPEPKPAPEDSSATPKGAVKKPSRPLYASQRKKPAPSAARVPRED